MDLDALLKSGVSPIRKENPEEIPQSKLTTWKRVSRKKEDLTLPFINLPEKRKIYLIDEAADGDFALNKDDNKKTKLFVGNSIVVGFLKMTEHSLNQTNASQEFILTAAMGQADRRQ